MSFVLHGLVYQVEWKDAFLSEPEAQNTVPSDVSKMQLQLPETGG